ncbi:MAG: alpha/beta fold hydrolase [Gemmatimonadota bacterium]|nr:alpha/beta fold hydrolase [Gemmatimonadota bacterium]
MESQSANTDNTCTSNRETVVLYHGLGRTKYSMLPLVLRLRAGGFRVINIGYPSRRHTIERLAGILHEKLELSPVDSPGPLHFVTHSMGGILLRRYLKDHPEIRVGRVVMLAPPNSGSELVDFFGRTVLLRLIYGPAGCQLGTSATSAPNTLGPVDFELGVIAGNRTWNPLYSALIPGPDDGKVAVDRCRVEGMKDFTVVPHSHGFIMNSRRVAELVVNFLRHREFG